MFEFEDVTDVLLPERKAEEGESEVCEDAGLADEGHRPHRLLHRDLSD